ncbi:hypothetical protein D3C75_1135060 [compost metagenome]
MAIKGRGRMAARVNFQLTRKPIASNTVAKKAVESVNVSMPKPAVVAIERRSLVARAIRSPVLFFSKKGGVIRNR